MSYHCGGLSMPCYQFPTLAQEPKPICNPCPKPKREMMSKDYKLLKKPLLDMLETDRLMKIRINMENRSHEQKIHDEAKLKMKERNAVLMMDLDNRRDKLKVQLEKELECYRQEIIDNYESKSNSRINEMRAKVDKLRSKREKQQKKIVDEKLDLVFQSQCDEMRTILSKKINREIAEDWKAQMWEKRRLECEQQEEERMWACLNLVDMEEKLKREQAYQNRREEFNRKAIEEMNKQMELKKMKKANLAKIAEIEREMIDADLAALAAEKKRLKDEKAIRFQKTKEHVKDMMDTRNFYRERKLKREEIVAKEFLKKAVRELYIEQEDRDRRKKDLMQAITIYTDYLKKWNCLENSREEVIQRIIDGVIEEQHDKVMASRKREHLQRRQLFETVQAGRRLQIEDLKKKKEMDEIEQRKEIQMLKDEWKEYLAEIEQEKVKRKAKSAQYRSDLDCQVAYNNLVKERNTKEVIRENEMCEIEEQLFKKRLESTVQQEHLSKSNPYRQQLVGKEVKQCYFPLI